MYKHAPENYVCPFCLLVRGIENNAVHSVQNDIVFQNESVTAFIGSHQWPRNHGNTIVVPNEHFENIFDLPERYAEDVHRAARLISLAMKSVYACDGISLRQHNEPAGYQDVWHYHVHVTPRYKDDQLYPLYGERALMLPEARAGHAQRLKEALASLA